MLRWIGLLLVAGGCSSGVDSDTDADTSGGLCGAVTEHTWSVDVRVVDGAGAAVEGATVRLEEREWEPGTVGQAVTDASGDAALPNLTLTGVEDCWGVVLDYVLVVEKDATAVDTNVNSGLFNAIQAGENTYSREVTFR